MIERAIATYYGGSVPMDSYATPPPGPGVGAQMPARFERVARHVPPTPTAHTRDAEIDALQDRLSKLEAMIERDQQVLRMLLALLVDKQVATRDEIVARLK